MRLSSLADYAVVLMSAAAGHCGAHGLTGRHSARQLSEETGIPLPTAQKLLQALARADLIESTRGASGGIRLARPPAAITLAHIVEAIEGPIAITDCMDANGGSCVIKDDCKVKPHWGVVNGAIRNALDAVSLADLARKPQSPKPQGRNIQQPTMMEEA